MWVMKNLEDVRVLLHALINSLIQIPSTVTVYDVPLPVHSIRVLPLTRPLSVSDTRTNVSKRAVPRPVRSHGNPGEHVRD